MAVAEHAAPGSGSPPPPYMLARPHHPAPNPPPSLSASFWAFLAKMPRRRWTGGAVAASSIPLFPIPPPAAPKIDGTRASPLCFRAPPLDRPLPPPPPPPPLPSPPRDLAAGIARHRTRWIDRRPGRAFRLPPPTAADTDDGGAGGPILPPTPALVGDRCFPPPAVIARDTHGELSVLGLLAVWLLDDEMRGDANVSLFFRSVRCRYAPCGRGVLRGHWGCHAGLLVSLLALGLERNVRFLCSRSWGEFFVNDHFGSRGTDGRRVTRLV